MSRKETRIGGEQRKFPSTSWSIILESQDIGSQRYRECIEKLISLYWKPVYIYIKYGWSKTNEEAKDLTQQYFASFLEKELIQNVSKERGRFRTYIKKTLKNFLLDMKRKDHAIKRGGSADRIPLDTLNLDKYDIPSSMDPSEIFEVAWSRTVLENALSGLKTELERLGKGTYFNVFSEYYEPEGGRKLTREQIAEKFGLTLNAVKDYHKYSKKLLLQIMTKIVSDYLPDTDDTEDELRIILSNIRKL